MSEEERKRRQNLEELLHKMKYSLNVTASTHYLAAAHYRQVDTYLQYASYITGVLGTSEVLVRDWRGMFLPRRVLVSQPYL